uniref:Uncharacterized protein n=1 Tax=Oryza brachyantha TaxID=4533 RepID=J3NDS5_ORYBR
MALALTLNFFLNRANFSMGLTLVDPWPLMSLGPTNVVVGPRPSLPGCSVVLGVEVADMPRILLKGRGVRRFDFPKLHL